MSLSEKERLQQSWIANASSWSDAVRLGKIASRRAATDAAIIEVVTSLAPRRVLDLGCGEGWLTRELCTRGIDAIGVDRSAPLIEAANQLGGASFLTLSYEELASHEFAEPFDAAVANFSILDDDTQPLLSAAARILNADGALVIQTIHPTFVAGDEPYANGWRTETFAAIEGEWPAPMPWYFRTLERWAADLSRGGYFIAEIREPRAEHGARPLSIIFVCRRGRLPQ
jgi:2-polyprenyl-3-methyl-5-hydroxy-6-metoxy-1,4-benzoquinol methylase